MTHISEGDLRAYLDQELTATTDVQTHLAGCSVCAAALAALQTRGTRLTALFHAEDVVVPSLHRARTRLQTHQRPVPVEPLKETLPMQPRRRFPVAYAALATAALLVVALMLPPVQTWASQVLGLFRVQQVTVLPIDFQSLEGGFNEESGTLLSEMLSENVKSEPVGEMQQVATWEEASAASGLTVRTPAYFDTAPTSLTVTPGTKADITLDAARLRAIVEAMGRTDITIPDSLNGAVVNVDLPQGVSATWGDCSWEGDSREGEEVRLPTDCTTFIQLPSPTVTTPPDLDMVALGQLYLELLGMDRDEAATFGASLDWSTTLVVPIPANEAEYQDVTVDGTTGTLIFSRNRPYEGDYIVIWVKDGILYTVTGQGASAEALAIANSLQ